MPESAAPVQVIEETTAYWRVVFDYPPFNIVDATIFKGLQDLLARMDASPSLRVVLFESANREFYLSHFDLTGKTGNITTAVGPSGLPILTDTFVRFTKSPVVSIAKIRGCVRGVSSEFVLACDMRFASRENTLLGQPEVGVRSEEHTSELQSRRHLVCRLLLEKKKMIPRRIGGALRESRWGEGGTGDARRGWRHRGRRARGARLRRGGVSRRRGA